MSSKKPHLTGLRQKGVLRGKRFELVLTGEQWSSTTWAGSEYTERLETNRWYAGEGTLCRLNRKKPIACFLTTFIDPPQGGQFEEGVLGLTDWHLRGRRITEFLVPGKLEELIDYVCEQALKSYRAQAGHCVPRVSIGGFSLEELVDRGFAFDPRGQAHLPLVA